MTSLTRLARNWLLVRVTYVAGPCVSHSEVRVRKDRLEACKISWDQLSELADWCISSTFLVLRHMPSLDSGAAPLTPLLGGRSYKITAEGTEEVKNCSHVCSYFTTIHFPPITSHLSSFPTTIYWAPALCQMLFKVLRTQVVNERKSLCMQSSLSMEDKRQTVNKWINTIYKVLSEDIKCYDENITEWLPT